MKFKPENKARLEKEWNDPQLAPWVRHIVEDCAKYAKKKWNWDFLITSIYRTPEEDAALKASGIHAAWRAADVRTMDQKKEAVDDVTKYANTKWKYDPQRPKMIICFSEPHGSGVHAHFQVHPNTVQVLPNEPEEPLKPAKPEEPEQPEKPPEPEKPAKPAKPPKPGKPVADVVAASFKGSALPLDEKGVEEITGLLGVKAPELWAVLAVETRGCGFQPNRRPFILFERHIFSRRTNGAFNAQHPDIANTQAGGYGAGGDHQYDRLQRAIALNRTAALESASWGIGQVMGFNANISGFNDVEDMVSKMLMSETEQLRGMAGFIIHNGLNKALQRRDWAAFARGYNGASFAKNKYDTKLAAAFARYAAGGMPDLNVRAAQIYLTYLGFNPGTIDGFSGKMTFSALNEFQAKNNLTVENNITDKVLKALAKKVAG